MPESTSEAPKQHPSRRLVLKAGAHAAWAVPAIQIAAATPVFAASPDSKLSVVISNVKQNGATLTFDALVTASTANAKSVNLNISGSITAPQDISIPTVTTTGGGVLKSISVTLTNTASSTGVVTATATGLSNSGSGALSGSAMAYAAADVSFAPISHSYNKSTKVATLSTSVTVKYAPATLTWSSVITPAGYTGITSGTDTVKPGTTTLSNTWTWGSNAGGNADRTFTVDLTSVTANAGKKTPTGTPTLKVNTTNF